MLLESSLKSKKVDFSKVLEQIDGMVDVLKKEQADDDSQKDFCNADLAKAEDEKSATESAIETSTAAISEMSSSSASLADEIKTLNAEVVALDKAVAEATEQRKAEHAEFLQFQTENNAAVQLIEKAKNHLFKFYRPNLHKEAPKRELTDEEKILAASGRSDMIATDAPVMIAGTTQAVFVQLKDDAAPPPPPDTWGAYQKKDGKSNGVISLMEMLAKELEDGITESKHEEETSQKDYERLMADLDTKVEQTKQKKASQETELSNIKGYIT